MGKPTVHAETLQRAALALGSEERLAGALREPVELVRRWLAGDEYVPTPVYQKALDLLIGIGTH